MPEELSPIVDLDPTPGNPTSLLRTFVGLHLRDLGEWISIGALLELLATAGISASTTRSAVSRLKGKGLIIPEKRQCSARKFSVRQDVVQHGIARQGVTQRSGQQSVAGYRLDPAAVTALERGDRRIFSYRGQRDDEPWCLVSYSLPEVDRPKRVQLRKALMGLGFGAVTDGLWIAPGHLRAETEEALETLEVRTHATIFITQTPLTAGPFAQAAASWWDLERLAARHTEFIDRYESYAPSAPWPEHAPRSQHATTSEHAPTPPKAPTSPPTPAGPSDSFVLWLRCVDDWKAIPYVDPGLPIRALPEDWPGMRSVELFAALRRRFAGPAQDHVREIAASGRAQPAGDPQAPQPSNASSTNWNEGTLGSTSSA